MSDNFEITEEQRAVATALISEGMRIERERIAKIIGAINSKTISVNKLSKLIVEE